MRRLERILAWFVAGGIIGSIIGAIAGLMDGGSMMILMPSGSAFWAIVGAFFGCIAGVFYGAFSRLPKQDAPFTSSEQTGDGSKQGEQP